MSNQTMAAPIADWQRPVVRVPLNQAFAESTDAAMRGLAEIREFKSRVCLFNHDRTRLFDVVSPRYQLVEHAQAESVVRLALEKYFGRSDIERSLRTYQGGARLRAEYKLPIAPIKLAGKDVNEITLQLQNSYDRSSRFHATLGAYRLICSNGAKIGESFGSVTQVHIGSADETQASLGITDGNDSILDQLGVVIARAPLVKELWETWQDQKLQLEEAQGMFAEGAFPAKYAGPIFEPRRWAHGRTKWEYYNDLTHMSTHLTNSAARRQQFDDMIAAAFYPDMEFDD